jgi:hypothetical protein
MHELQHLVKEFLGHAPWWPFWKCEWAGVGSIHSRDTYLYTLQQKKLCMVKIAMFFQPWQITRWNKLLMKVHEIFQMVNRELETYEISYSCSWWFWPGYAGLDNDEGCHRLQHRASRAPPGRARCAAFGCDYQYAIDLSFLSHPCLREEHLQEAWLGYFGREARLISSYAGRRPYLVTLWCLPRLESLRSTSSQSWAAVQCHGVRLCNPPGSQEEASLEQKLS